MFAPGQCDCARKRSEFVRGKLLHRCDLLNVNFPMEPKPVAHGDPARETDASCGAVILERPRFTLASPFAVKAQCLVGVPVEAQSVLLAKSFCSKAIHIGA